MSQHISGNVGQRVSQDFGEFILVGNYRIRKQLVISYGPCPIDDSPNKPYGVRIFVQGLPPVGIPIGQEEEAKIEVEKLDWLFKKDNIE